jgi:hypothetical protein
MPPYFSDSSILSVFLYFCFSYFLRLSTVVGGNVSATFAKNLSHHYSIKQQQALQYCDSPSFNCMTSYCTVLNIIIAVNITGVKAELLRVSRIH